MAILINDKIFDMKMDKWLLDILMMKNDLENFNDNLGFQGLIFTLSIALTLVRMMMFALLKKIGR